MSDPSAPTAPPWLRAHRAPLVIGALVLTVLVLLTVATLGAAAHGGTLDPENPDPEGAQAVARVLAAHGVHVDVVRRAAELDHAAVGADTTVLVTSVGSLGRSTARGLARDTAGAASVVLTQPGPVVLGALHLPFRPVLAARSGDLPAACRDALLQGLTVHVDSLFGYRPTATGPAAGTCFAVGHAGMLGRAGSRYVLGSDELLRNSTVTAADNAAVALRLLGAHPRLVWYVPDVRDVPVGDAGSVAAQLPRWLDPALVLLGLAGLAGMLWRARRLGPLVVEPLPVTVRALESTAGRGRLYRKVRDRDHAARILRGAARRRLARQLRVNHPADPVLAGVVAYAAGRPVDEVATLLGDAPVHDDTALTELAIALDALEEEVRRP